MAIQDLYPSIRPSLDLNFAGSKTVDPRITFTRASSATYFDEFAVLRTASNNVPRIDHNPVTGECLGLLIEEQRTNLMPHSEQFDNAGWNKVQSTITPNAVAAPDGTLTADLLIEDTSNNQHTISRGQSLLANTTYTLSVYVKPAGRTLFRMAGSYINNWSVGSPKADFDLMAGTVSNIVGDGAGIQPVGNGWYRCHLTATFGAADNLGGMNIITLISSSSITYQGDGTSGICIWGAQLEAGSQQSSYIKTESSQVTRAADSAVMTGSNFSSWYSQSEGTLLLEMMWPTASITSTASGVSFSDNTYQNFIRISRSGTGNTPQMSVLNEGVLQATPFSTSVQSGAFFKTASAYKTNDFAFALNGVQTANSTDTEGAVPVVNRMYFGDPMGNTQARHIKRLSYYPKRLSNDNLIALTT